MNFRRVKNILLLCLLSFLASCGLFIQLDQPDDQIVYKKINKQRICNKKTSMVLGSQTGNTIYTVKRRLLNISKELKLSPIESFSTWSLLQLYLRPDKVSPNSSLQFIDANKRENDYFSFNRKKTNSNLYYDSIRFLLKKYGSKKSLLEISKIATKVIPQYQLIDKDTARSLLKNRSLVMKDKRARRYYFKGQQVLREGEAIKTFDITKSVSKSKRKSITPKTYLFEEKISKNKTIRCNFDLNIYRNGIYLIEPNKGDDSHPFSFSYKGNNFMAVASQVTNFEKLSPRTYNFQANSTQTQKAICKIQNGSNRITIISSSGRDTGQHIFNLLEYKISSINSTQELIEILDFPRYIFLLNPKRMIYESDRSSSEQIQTFLNTGFPIYHRPNLGNVWINYQIGKKSGQILDGRKDNSLSCLK
jgi:hypothetical protein